MFTLHARTLEFICFQSKAGEIEKRRIGVGVIAEFWDPNEPQIPKSSQVPFSIHPIRPQYFPVNEESAFVIKVKCWKIAKQTLEKRLTISPRTISISVS